MDITEKIHLEKLYKETLEDYGKSPPREFLFALKEKGELFLRARNKTKSKNPKSL